MKIPKICLLLGFLILPALRPVAVAEPPKCTCVNGNGTYQFLNAPVDPSDDDPHCPADRADIACSRKLPSGWDHTCANNSRMECFLRRHGASWRMACSERLKGKCACKSAHPEWCPYCGASGHEWDTEGLEVVKRQLEVERRIFGKRAKLIILRTPHFYVVSDVRSLKIRTKSGGPRVMGAHEIAHVFAQRAEVAYMDFVRHFGDRVLLQQPMAVFVVAKNRTQEDIQATYFGGARTNIIYGGGSKSISGGFPGNGFAVSLQKSRDDHGLHLQVRHSIAHILMSCWIKVNGQERYLPKWVHVGVAHWLARLPRPFREMATFCGNESTPISNNGKKWHVRLLKIAGSAKSRPIQRLFEINTTGSLDLDDHVRAWSYFKVFLEEDRERFVKFISLLRDGKDHRNSLKDSFGCTPEEWDRRWKQRILGRRPTVAATAKELDSSDPTRPGAKERASIRTETDPVTLAAKIRALQAINDPLTAATVVPLLRTDNELVRE
ncbi:MAG: hypothetical protein ABFS86_20790, partial [Planctomycetota bacterium]